MTIETHVPPSVGETAVVGRLSTLDRFLPVWIIAAMAAGLLLGRFIPGLNTALDAVKVGSVSLPIAVGLLVMMYPVLAKVRYNETRRVTGDRKLLLTSLVLNWVLAPAFMFALAWIFIPDLPDYRTGLIIVGLARCIAMVMIWNDLACGDREAAAVLVAINSVFQVLAFGAMGWFYLQILPAWLGLPTTSAGFSFWAITASVLIFLGIPLLAGFLTRTLGERTKGRSWYEEKFLPKLGPWALYGLLFTIVVLFALQGGTITSRPLDVVRDRRPAGRLFHRRLRRGHGHWPGPGSGLCQDHDAGIHRGGEQLRTRHRGGHRHLRGRLRAGAGRRGRAADRGPGPGRPGLRRALGPQTLLHPLNPAPYPQET